MPTIRRRLKISLSSTDVDYDQDQLEEYEYSATLEPRLFSSTAWIPPVELAGMPTTVDVMVENTDTSDDIRFYYDYLASAYVTVKPGRLVVWPNLTWTASNQFRLVGQGSGLVPCKVTILGNY